ncbi:YqzE family protein [Aneurinibacillus danicus]|uniref:YqzE family protein n=1 Tax=Aneurinibacillus danicus TaxID=267746 RepID=A0A511VCP9_9BACL|nr:YqzE family protein [Aneurinibacillus danicus]GEN35012.1 hypothetical protein ADA01nite_24720 [Aneurinibacillus danicus]
MSSQEYVKYLAQRFVKYMETPKEQRTKKPKEKLLYRWFGMLPLSLSMLIRRRRK